MTRYADAVAAWQAAWRVGASMICAAMLAIVAEADSAEVAMSMDPDSYVLSNGEITVALSRERGTVTSITSLQPEPLEVLPETNDGLALWARHVTSGRKYCLNAVKRSTVEEGADGAAPASADA